MISTLAIAGYRSLRDVRLELGRLSIVTGANGSGKSSLYRALRLMADIAHGRVIASLAQEGGLTSTLWAGPESFGRSVKRGELPVQGTIRKHPIALKLGFSGDDYGYSIELGYPVPGHSAFNFDPEIKLEALWTGHVLTRSSVMAERRGPSVRIRNGEGAWAQALTTIPSYDSMMTHCADPREGPELLLVREAMREWRFYDHFRTDRDAPARRPQIGTRTPVLASDGADLAAAIQTISEVGAGGELADAIADAFPGATIEVTEAGGYFEVEMRQHGLLRPLKTAELSDGTLRYLLLVAALLSPRPPALMILNEPETSLHADLIAPLARLIAAAAKRSQLLVVSHAANLIHELTHTRDCQRIVLEKSLSETRVLDGAGDEMRPAWTWPGR